jgi:hypothetical protein
VAEFVLTATYFFRQEDGMQVKHVQGDVITGLSDEDVDRLLKCGAIVEESSVAPAPVADAPSEPAAGQVDRSAGVGGQNSAAEPPAIPADDPHEFKRPPRAASHDKWVAYVHAATGRPTAELEKLSKEQLQAIEV